MKGVVGGRVGDVTRETVGQPVPVILPDPARLFTQPADRLEILAVEVTRRSSPPVAGVIRAAGSATGARYLHCALFASAWNHVRAVCITCGGSRGLSLLGLEAGSGAVQAETCDECRTYAKMLYQAKDMAVEP